MVKKDEVSNISLLVEDYPRYGFQALSKILEGGREGLCITRLHPDYVRQKYGLGDLECHWLSTRNARNSISPKSIERLINIIEKGFRDGNKKLIFMDGLEYILIWNDFKKVMDILGSINELLKENVAEMFICVDPLTLEQNEKEKLWNSFPHYPTEELAEAGPNRRPQRTSEVLQLNEDQKSESLVESGVSHAIP